MKKGTEKPYEVINLEKEYPGFKGECKWAVATDLSSEELFARYGDELEKYNPVILLSTEHAQVFKSFNRNEKKNLRRMYRYHDPRGYIDGNELNQKAFSYIDYLALDTLIRIMIKCAFDRLTEAQRRRIRLRYKFKLTERQIAYVEGVSQAAVHYSIKSGLEVIRKYVI